MQYLLNLHLFLDHPIDAHSMLHTIVSNEIPSTKSKIEGLKFQPKNKS